MNFNPLQIEATLIANISNLVPKFMRERMARD